jgi:hypothetical protein
MARLMILFGVTLVGFTLAAAGQEPKITKDAKDLKTAVDPKDKKDATSKTEPLTVPPGWKAVTAKDDSHAFLVPKEAGRERTSENTSTRAGSRVKIIDYEIVFKKGLTLSVVQTNLSGAITKDLKIKDVYESMYDADKSEKGNEVTEPTEFLIGKLKGREYYVTNKEGVHRVVSLVVKGRSVQMTVSSDKKENVQTKECDTFLTSLILKAPAKKDGDPKDAAKKDGEGKPTPKKEAEKKEPEKKSPPQ